MSKQTVVGVLRASREFLRNPANWGQGAYECDGRYCAIGVIGLIIGEKPTTGVGDPFNSPLGNRAVNLLDVAAAAMGASKTHGEGPCVEVNDERSHADVLTMFNKAIKRAER